MKASLPVIIFALFVILSLNVCRGDDEVEFHQDVASVIFEGRQFVFVNAINRSGHKLDNLVLTLKRTGGRGTIEGPRKVFFGTVEIDEEFGFVFEVVNVRNYEYEASCTWDSTVFEFKRHSIPEWLQDEMDDLSSRIEFHNRTATANFTKTEVWDYNFEKSALESRQARIRRLLGQLGFAFRTTRIE